MVVVVAEEEEGETAGKENDQTGFVTAKMQQTSKNKRGDLR